MTSKQIAETLGVSERHARRLKAAQDPRIVALEKADTADIEIVFSAEELAQLDREAAARKTEN